MKLIRNKFIIGILCIAIGVTAGFILLPRSQRSEITMTQVVRLTHNVKAGEQLTQENMETTTVPSTSVPGGASSAVEAYRGKYAVTQLFAGDILMATKVRDTLVDPVAAGAAKGKQLVSLTVPTLTAGVSGALLPGDVVAVMVTSKVTQFNQQLGLLVATEQASIYTEPRPEYGGESEQETEQQTEGTENAYTSIETDNDGISGVNQTLYSSIQKESETYIPEELRYLEVCKVTSSDGTDALVNPAKDPDVPNRLPSTITFYVTEEQALKLAEIEQNDDIHIAFLARGDAADVYIPREERVLVEEPIPEPTPSPEPTTAPVVSSEPVEPTAETPQESASPEVSEPPASTSIPEASVPAETESTTVTTESGKTEAPNESIESAEPADPSSIDFNDPEVGE